MTTALSVQSALDFLRTARDRPDLQEKIAAWGPAPTAAQLVGLASQAGFACSEAELHEAFRHDWAMRWFAGQASPRDDPTANPGAPSS
jgi:hypothetical protein